MMTQHEEAAWDAAAGDPAAMLALEIAEQQSALPRWADALAGGPEGARVVAAHELEQAARYGRDLAPFVSALAGALARGPAEVRAGSAAALARAASGRGVLDLAPALDALTAAFTDGDERVRIDCVATVREAARRGADVAHIVPALAARLGDEAGAVRRGAAFALRLAAEKGTDVTAAVPGLAALLQRIGHEQRVMAARALVRASRAGADMAPALDALARAAAGIAPDLAASARDALAAWEKRGPEQQRQAQDARARRARAGGVDAELVAAARLLRPDANGLVGFGPREVAAAEAIQNAAAAGRDLSPHLADLRRSAEASTQIPVSQPLVNALALHWLRAGRPEELRGLPFAFTVEDALRFAEKQGVAVDAAARARALGEKA